MGYYILSPSKQLCGYDKIPFGIYDCHTRHTEFVNRERYAILLQCDGNTRINEESMSESEKIFFYHNLKNQTILPCQQGAKLSPAQEYKRFHNQYKESVQWSITGNCNFHCKHCFMSANEGKYGEPSTAQCIKVIREMADCGIRRVGITGGEPLIRPDFWTIMDELKKKEIAVTTLYTNGALVNETLLEGFVSRDIHPSFQLSFDGVGWHDWLRGINGAEKMVLDAFRLLQKYHIGASAAMVLHKKNQDSIRESVRLLHEVGCQSLKINVASPSGQWCKQKEYFMTSDDGFQAYLKYLPHYFEDGAPINLMLDGAFLYDTRKQSYSIPFDKGNITTYKNVPVCGSLRSNLYLSPEGAVIPCMSMIDEEMTKQYPNAFITPLQEILKESSYTRAMTCKVSDYMAQNPECVTCPYTYNCKGGCRANGVIHGGNYLSPDRKACAYFKHGWYKRFQKMGQQYAVQIETPNLC